MIPKTIHYCRFGGKPLPRMSKSYISKDYILLITYTWWKYERSYKDVYV